MVAYILGMLKAAVLMGFDVFLVFFATNIYAHVQ